MKFIKEEIDLIIELYNDNFSYKEKLNIIRDYTSISNKINRLELTKKKWKKPKNIEEFLKLVFEGELGLYWKHNKNRVGFLDGNHRKVRLDKEYREDHLIIYLHESKFPKQVYSITNDNNFKNLKYVFDKTLTIDYIKFLYTEKGKGLYNNFDINSRALKDERAGCLMTDGYRKIQILGKSYNEHALIWFIHKGRLPIRDIDHINRIRDYNTYSNLREVTRKENRNNSSKILSNIVGVTFNKSKWHVRLDGIHLGTFDKKEKAEVFAIKNKNYKRVKLNITQKLIKEKYTLNYETGWLTYNYSTENKRKGERAGTIDINGYRIVKLDHIPYKEHRVIYFYINGHWPAGQIDHINGIKDDNRPANLQDVSQSINQLRKGGWKFNSWIESFIKIDKSPYIFGDNHA